MAKYLIDTDVLIDFLDDKRIAVKLVKSLIQKKHDLGTSCINVCELYSGIPKDQWEKTDAFIENLTYFNVTKNVAKQAGAFRFDFARRGITLATTDTIIAATAIWNNATVITANVKDYPEKEVKVLKLKRT